MIKLANQVPLIYSNASRDFQYLSWLFNIVLNSVKHNVDDMYDLPNSKIDPKMSELLAFTLGFKIKRNYDQKQLIALVQVLPIILKHKGTKKAIEIACDAVVNASGAVGIYDVVITDTNVIEILLPKDITDTTLLIDLLPYILPAGLSYRIVKRTEIQSIFKTEVDYQDTITAKWYKDVYVDRNDVADNSGLANLFDAPSTEELSFNIKDINTDEIIPNAGLLDNLVIPVLDKPANNK